MRFNKSRFLLLALVGLMMPLSAQSQRFESARQAKTEQTGIAISNVTGKNYGAPLGFIILKQVDQSLMVGFDLGDMTQKTYRVDVYQYPNCDAPPPYGEKQWQPIIGQRWDVPVSEVIGPGDPLAVINPTPLGMIRANVLIPNLPIASLYDKSIIIREGVSLKNPIIACGAIFKGRPVPQTSDEGIKIDQPVSP